MEAAASVIGIKSFCSGAGISEASYHNIRHDLGKKKVLGRVESYLNSQELQESLKTSKSHKIISYAISAHTTKNSKNIHKM
jgi:hypothetical protein